VRAVLIAILVTALSVCVACVGPTFIVQQYNGPPRPRESIAILRVNGADSVRLLFLDEEDVAAPVASDSRLHIEVLPGKHSLTARNGDDRSAPTGSLAFEAEPGKVYRIVFSGETAHLYEVDRESDKPTREVSPPAPPTPAPSAPPLAAPRAEPPVTPPPAESAPSPPPTGSSD
jgi:hypothetical protein